LPAQTAENTSGSAMHSLVFLIWLAGWFQGPAASSASPEFAAIRLIKSEVTLFLESVDVADAAPTEYRFCAVPYASENRIIYWDCCGYSARRIRPKYILSGSFTNLSELQIVGVPNTEFSPNFEFICWGLPIIFDDNVDLYAERHLRVRQFRMDAHTIPGDYLHGAAINENIGSQLSFGGLLGSSDEIACGAPQKPSRHAQNSSKNGDDALSVDPFEATTPRIRSPFLPVFGLGALTFLASMFAGIHIDDWGRRLSAEPRRKWYGRLLKATAVLLICLGAFGFAFAFSWAGLL